MTSFRDKIQRRAQTFCFFKMDIDFEREFTHPKYKITKKLGKGLHSQVYEVKTEANKTFAIKIYNVEGVFEREQKMLKDIQEKLAILPIGEHFVSNSNLKRFGRKWVRKD